jgi:hypothetical protein
MFENTQKKGKGWFEEPSVRNDKGQFVAKEHSEALTRAKYAKDKPSCVPVCLAPCGHKKDEVEVDVDEIIDDEQDKRNIKDAEKIDEKEESEDLEVDVDEVDKENKGKRRLKMYEPEDFEPEPDEENDDGQEQEQDGYYY